MRKFWLFSALFLASFSFALAGPLDFPGAGGGGSGTGDIEGVTAGTGLSGGGTSGTVTLNLNTSGMTSDYLQYWNGSALVNSGLYQASGRISLNTVLNYGLLHISTSTSGKAGIIVQRTTGGDYGSASNPDLIMYNQGNPLGFIYANTGGVAIGDGTDTVLYVSTNDNVGIGINPTGGSDFYIKAPSGDTQIRLYSSASGVTDSDGLLLSIGTSDINLLSYESLPLRFGTSGTEFMRIGTNGRVGISTTAAVAALAVSGGIVASSSITAQAGFYGDGSNLTGITGVADNFGNHTATRPVNMAGFPIDAISSMTLRGNSSAPVIKTTHTALSLVTSTDGGTTLSTHTVYASSLTVATGGNTYPYLNDGTSVTKKRFFPASAFQAASTNGSITLQQVESSTNKVNWESLALSSSTTQYVFLSWSPPTAWNAGAVNYDVVWTSTGATSGTVVWQLQAVALANDDALDTAYGTAVANADTFITASDVHKTTNTASVTVGNTPTTGDFVGWRLLRKVDDASDTMNGLANLIGVWIGWTETGYLDD